MKFDAAIFDLDGTLLDSLDDIANAANEVLHNLGKPTFPVSDYKYLVGDGVRVLFERALPETLENVPLRDECMRLFEESYEQQWNKRSKPYTGIMEMLIALVDRGVRVGILSNKPDAFAKRCAGFFFPGIDFDLAVGHSSAFPRKPDPSSALWMAQQMGIESSRIAYVGDTNTDMKTAVGASFYAIGVTWGFRPETELRQHGAQSIVQSAEQLTELLLS